MKKTYYLTNKTMSGSCRVFPSRDSSFRELRGSPSKRVTHSWFVLLALLLSFVVFNSVSALTYQNDTNVDFTINPTISVSLSGDLLINDLAPGSYADSNIITVNAATNASHGYYLAATVGDSNSSSSNHNTNLTHSTNSYYTFTKLSSNAANLSDFSDNQWGYSYSTDNGTNWVSGSQGSTSSGYNGLPLDGNDSGATSITLIDTTSPVANNSVKFKIGAKASNTQPAGTYTNTINFYAVTHQAPLTFDDAFAAAGKIKYLNYYKMQDMTSDICANAEQGFNTKLIDVRDNEIYTIAKLKDDNCWMLDNLRLDPTSANLSADNTNATAAGITNYLNGGNPNNVDGWSSSAVTNVTNNFWSYTVPQINTTYKNEVATSRYGIGSGKYGVYYNYCAATTGTYCYSGESGADLPNTIIDSLYDVCPANWRMPTSSAEGDYQILYNQYSDTKIATDTNSLQYNLSLPLSGFFDGNAQVLNGSGNWWSSTYYSDSNKIMYILFVTSSSIFPQGNGYRADGFSVRCLAK